MIESLFSTTLTETLTIQTALSVIFAALAMGLFISFVYTRTRGKDGYSLVLWLP